MQDISNSKNNRPVRKSLAGIEPFNDIIYKGCFNSMLFPVLIYLKKSILPILINDVPVYQYNQETEEFNILYLPYEPMDLVLKHMGVEMITKISSRDLIADLTGSISDGRAVIINVDCYYNPNRKDTFNSMHWAHNLLVYGYDSLAEQFDIIDHRNRESLLYEKCNIGFEHLVNSYKGYIEYYKNSDMVNSSFIHQIFREGDELPTYFEFARGSTACDSVDFKEYAHIYGRNLCCFKRQIIETLPQLEAYMNKLSEILSDENELGYKAKYLAYVISFVISAKRAEQYKINKLFGNKTETGRLLEKNIEAWSHIRSKITKYHFLPVYKKNDFILCKNMLEQIYRDEAAYYEELYDFLDNLRHE